MKYSDYETIVTLRSFRQKLNVEINVCVVTIM